MKTTNGVTQTKLMFPTSWDAEVVLDQIAQGCCNIDKTIACGDGSFNIECSTNAGLRMQMHVDQSGTIRTCTPLESAATHWAIPEEAKTLCKLRLSEPGCTIVPVEEVETYRKYTDLISKATPEEAAALCSGIKHNFNGKLTTNIEERVRKTFFRKLSTDTRSCLNLDSRNGGIGSIARLNDMLCQNGVNCRIVPSKQLIRVARSFEIKSIEVFGQKIRSIYLPEGLADEFVGGRVFGANFRHSFDHECNGVKNILGGHWDPGGHLERLGILKVDSIKQGINGCYRANAKLLNRSYHPEKSYFGKDWTAEQISQALCESFENITKAKKSYDGRWRLIGKAKNGLKVEMIVLPQNGGWFVETFYPLIN
ncbi:EndoU domain-containing protein [bacterium]|nr:EndoU domain-containing protein [bacterium]